MDIELDNLNEQQKAEIQKIKDKYNSLKKEVRKKYKQIEKQNQKKNKRKTIPKSVKDKLWDDTFGSSKGEGECYVCNTLINSKKFDCGHITSVKNGGSDSIENLKPICSTCNKSMGVENLEEFKSKYFQNNETPIQQSNSIYNITPNLCNICNKEKMKPNTIPKPMTYYCKCNANPNPYADYFS
tara:strand:+ start:268 stop:819 length:552 start_codon:yes stop_codon:yes gene_type:complete